MAHKARAASFPPSPLSSESPTPSPPAPPTGTTPAATFPPLPPLQWRCLHTAQHRPALHGPSRRRRRVRHLRRHFCRWCKLFHVDASSRWRRSHRREEGGREEADPPCPPLSRLSLLFAPFPFHTQRLHAEQSAGRGAPHAGPGRRRRWSGSSGARSPAVSAVAAASPSLSSSSCCGSSKNEKDIVLLALPLQLFAFPPFVRTDGRAATGTRRADEPPESLIKK